MKETTLSVTYDFGNRRTVTKRGTFDDHLDYLAGLSPVETVNLKLVNYNELNSEEKSILEGLRGILNCYTASQPPGDLFDKQGECMCSMEYSGCSCPKEKETEVQTEKPFSVVYNFSDGFSTEIILTGVEHKSFLAALPPEELAAVQIDPVCLFDQDVRNLDDFLRGLKNHNAAVPQWVPREMFDAVLYTSQLLGGSLSPSSDEDDCDCEEDGFCFLDDVEDECDCDFGCENCDPAPAMSNEPNVNILSDADKIRRIARNRVLEDLRDKINAALAAESFNPVVTFRAGFWLSAVLFEKGYDHFVQNTDEEGIMEYDIYLAVGD